jgi:adenosylcobinamide-GDP ribazoletransferase
MMALPGRRALHALRAEPLAAVALLTRLPVASRDEAGVGVETGPAERTGAAAFGLVGAGLGAVGAIPLLLVGTSLPLLAAALGIVAIAVASGVLHLDGLADTADALAAPDPEAAERARADPRVGAAGAVAVVGAVIVDVAAVAGTVETAGAAVAALALVCAGSVSRAAAVLLTKVSAPASREGFGAWFAVRVGRRDVVAAVGSAGLAVLALAAVGGAASAAAAGAGAAVGIGLSVAIVRARGGLDGDGFGAGIEIVFAALLVAVAALSAVGGGAIGPVPIGPAAP